ncbi:hypothetical protein A4A49_35580 [Nicotiana attenuata]|uniref:Uncharacterized protein n=1 Tax=Nicotiana attenuata TaxID=49451 RepID=A0A1J6KP21_NICAT|nr:hypothetical protein A4A49_35580 [Nicotiana attenuata]
MVEKQFTKTIKIFQCDGGGEFNSTAFVEHLDNCDAPLDSSSDSTHIATFYEFFSRLQDFSRPDVHSSNLGEVLNGSLLIGVGDHPTADVNAPSPSDQLTPDSPVDALDEAAKPTPTTDHNAPEPADHIAESAESPSAAVPTGTDDLMTVESEEPNSSAQDNAPSDSNEFSVYDPQGIQLEVDLMMQNQQSTHQMHKAITWSHDRNQNTCQ